MVEYNDYFQLKNPLTRWKSKVSYKARQKMYTHFMKVTSPSENSNLLDIGVTPDTSLPESNFLEKWYPWKHNIVMTSVEDASNLEREFKGTKFVRTIPGASFPFIDKQFDIVFCSAVLEHVGDYPAQTFFIQECLRVGKILYLTTPNKYFPIEMHTYLPLVHLLPRKIDQGILRFFGMDFFSKTENLNLLTSNKIKQLLPNNVFRYEISYNKTFGLKSNIILFVENL
jgi:SAM-dependent methyltransferase